MAANETHDNNVLFYCMVWACDVVQWDWALKLCDYAAKTNQKNDNFRRSHAEIVAESVFRFCEKIFKSGAKMPVIWGDVFSRVFEKKWTVNDDLIARFLKIEADIISETEPKLALNYFKQATALKPDIGVKGRITALEKNLND